MRIFELWWKKNTRTLNISWFRGIRKENKRLYPDDSDANTEAQWGISTNGARKGIDSCLDWTLSLGHLEINYINWNYNR
ncbi:hypothetical protein [Paenibacillus cremeus]|uniref:Uncharacterized protein n=1 Tax=Paenibacillus cremeus TaxID=2163881 RepID=A0A559KCN8_9BACL|nr:hypothetical protein [Paenibacillus cremeus]TVY09873.1 hypothetical protein FPZ49_10905 [Paenibacillus cremeus]